MAHHALRLSFPGGPASSFNSSRSFRVHLDSGRIERALSQTGRRQHRRHRILKLAPIPSSDQNGVSISDRKQLNDRVTAMDNRMNGFDTKLDVMRSENTQGFQKIYDVMLQDAKSHSPGKP
jgi:hypothetical protein